jgi:hypothetical protein
MISPPWTRPRPSPRAHFEPCALLAHLPSPICALCPTPSPSLSLCPCEPRALPPPVSWPPLRSCLVQCHGELCLAVSYLGHPSVCPLPPCCARSMLTGAILAQSEPRRRRPEAPPHPRRSPSVPEFALEVSNLPMPLIRQVPHQSPRNCSPELAAPPRNLFHLGMRSLAPSCWFCAHSYVRRDVLNVSGPFPKPPEPRRG